jgi:glycosyltransferase involved in cell wall biosynthesis
MTTRASDTPDRPLRVLQVVLSLNPGGTEHLVVDLVSGLAGGVDSVVCCLDERGLWGDDLAGRGIPVLALGRRPGWQPRLATSIAAIVRDFDIDLLHCHHYTPFVYGQLAALLCRMRPTLYTEHGRLSDSPPSLKRRLLNPALTRFAEAIFAVSEDLRRHMIAEGLPARRIRVIYNGVEPGRLPSDRDRADARARLGLSRDAFVVGSVGRLDPVKDFSALLRAFAALPPMTPPAVLAIVGDGPASAPLKEEAGRLGVGERTRFLGYRADVRAVLPACDVYVNSSVHEGVSLTILEAMAAGLPVVASRVGGTPEIVEHGRTGFLVPPRSPAALAQEIARLAGDPDARKAFGDAGRARLERSFTIERMIDEYRREYARVGQRPDIVGRRSIGALRSSEGRTSSS